jgi:hypothetical protein
MPFVDRRELFAEAGKWVKGGGEGIDHWWGSLPLIASFLLEGW